MIDTSRRHFIENLARIGAAAGVIPAATILAEPAVASADGLCSCLTGRMERLQTTFTRLRDIIATDFPEFEMLFDLAPPSVDEHPELTSFGLLAWKPNPVEAAVIEYDGPGIYEIKLAGWRDGYTQFRRLELAPKRHRFAGQFRFRWPDAPPHRFWTYREKSDFKLIRRA